MFEISKLISLTLRKQLVNDMNKKLLLSISVIIFIAKVSSAQQLDLGVATSSHSRINSMYINPANIADSQEKITINIIGAGISADNNLGTISSFSNLGRSFTGNSSQAVFANSGRQNFSMMAPEVDIHGPSLIYSINKKHSLAITTGLRVMNQFNNFNQSLYSTLTNTASLPNTTNTYSAQKFNWTANMWNEVGLSYGGVIIDRPGTQLKVGVTVRRLGGIGYMSVKGNNLDINYTAGSDSFYSSHSDLEFASSIVSNKEAVFNGVNASNLLSSFLGGSAGSGMGADLGIIYSHCFGDDVTGATGSDVHNLSLSAAVKDIGAIKYSQNANAMINVTGNGYLTGQGLSNNVGDASSFKNYISRQGFTADTQASATKLHMPTALILSADYQLHNHFYVNATFLGNLADRQNFGNAYYNQFTITPRYDTRLITIGLPIAYSWLANDIKMGFAFRISGFFIGSNDMMALFANHQYGFSAYCGGYIPIKFKKVKRLEEHDHWERFVQ